MKILNIVKKMFIHSNESPRKWFRFMLFDQMINPRFFLRGLVYDSTGNLRNYLKAWVEKSQQNPPISKFNDWLVQRKKIVDSNSLVNFKTISIVCTKQTCFVAHFVKNQLNNCGYHLSIHEIMPERFDDDLYIVICPQVFKKLPPRGRRIVFQMEQSVSSRWFAKEYIDILYNSLAVFDYSYGNINFLLQKGIPRECLFHVQLEPILNYVKDEGKKSFDILNSREKYDVLFYGDIKCQRRLKFLSVLKSHFNVRIENNIYGDDLLFAIKNSKIVVNIHYYENALLESTRICECISLGARVVSEVASDQDQYEGWEKFVEFTPVNDVQSMVYAIKKILNDQSVGEMPMENKKFKFSSTVDEALHSLNISCRMDSRCQVPDDVAPILWSS